MGELPECVDGLPNLCGSEQRVEAAVAASRGRPVVGGRSAVDIAGIEAHSLDAWRPWEVASSACVR
jgi:hypothetical protein